MWVLSNTGASEVRNLNLQAGAMSSFGNNCQLPIKRTNALLDYEGAATILLQLRVREATAEFEAAPVIFNDQHPAAMLAGQPHEGVLRPTVTANIG
jgi:hypothetical protein